MQDRVLIQQNAGEMEVRTILAVLSSLEPFRNMAGKILLMKFSMRLEDLGCPDDVLHRAASRIEDYENSGFTFTNQEEHKSIIVINRPDSAEEFIDTYNHEKNHVEMHICKEFGIDPYSEKAAYLSGQLAKKLFKAQLRNWIR